MDTLQLHTEILQTKEELLGLLRSLSIKQLDTIPFEDSWTAGQVAEHILKSAGGITDVLRGNVTDTTRDPEEKVATLRKIFLDFSSRMKSPDFLVPTETIHPKEGLIHSLGHLFDSFDTAVTTLDLNPTCLDFELPNMGKLTRKEWSCFVLFHTQRHTHQLKNIALTLGIPAEQIA